MGFSVIIPVAVGDLSWRELLPSMVLLGADDEIIISSAEAAPKDFLQFIVDLQLLCQVKWVNAEPGRAIQLNFGARHATQDFYWFLHADSKIDPKGFSLLKKQIQYYPRALHFFNLKFMKDGPSWMPLNSIGVFFRSRILRLPFGDQGFCLHRDVWKELGGFSETAPYGEDHLFVWRAHQKKIKLRAVPAAIHTSARRYQKQGWLATTRRHLYLTWQQAMPELRKFIEQRVIN